MQGLESCEAASAKWKSDSHDRWALWTSPIEFNAITQTIFPLFPVLLPFRYCKASCDLTHFVENEHVMSRACLHKPKQAVYCLLCFTCCEFWQGPDD